MHDLDAIARRTIESLDDERPGIDRIEARVKTRQRRRTAYRAGVSGVLVVFVLVAGFWLFAPSNGATTVDTAARPDPRSELSPEWDVVIFLNSDSTPAEVAEVAELLDASPAIGEFEVQGQQEVYDEFVEFFADDPELLETIDAETMPISISAATDDEEAPVFFEVDDLPQVETIVVATGTIPQRIQVNGDPIFDIASSRRLFLGSIAGSEQGFVRCMQDEGFEVTVLDGIGFFPDEYLESLEERDDRALAEEWGFGLFSVNIIPVSPADARVGPQDPPGLSESDPYYRTAYGGDFAGLLGLFSSGCSGEAEDLWRNGERRQDHELIREVTDAFVVDPRVVEHYHEFSACMTNQGFSVTSPLDAYEQTGDRLVEVLGNDLLRAEQLVALDEEIELAVATVECGESVSDLVSPELREVWEEYAPGNWADNAFHIATPECLGSGAYQFDLTELLIVEQSRAIFPDSCFE